MKTHIWHSYKLNLALGLSSIHCVHQDMGNVRALIEICYLICNFIRIIIAIQHPGSNDIHLIILQ